MVREVGRGGTNYSAMNGSGELLLGVINYSMTLLSPIYTTGFKLVYLNLFVQTISIMWFTESSFQKCIRGVYTAALN